MSANFMCLKLINDNTEIISLTKLLLSLTTGFHAFYTHNGLITGILAKKSGSPAVLNEVFANQYKNLKIVSLKNKADNAIELCNQPETPLILIDNLSSSARAKAVQTFFQNLRQCLDDDVEETMQIGYSLNQAASWDLFLGREEYSGIVPEAHDYHEYLLWNDGGFEFPDNKADISENTSNDWEMWCGAGWMSSRLRKKTEDSKELSLADASVWLNFAYKQLNSSLDQLTHFYQDEPQSIEKNIINLEIHNTFVRSLCEFLPYHRFQLGEGEFIPSNGLGEKGGPMLWKGLLDDELYLRKRHLLMEGWLSLWP